jgi:hypothetical protein
LTTLKVLENSQGFSMLVWTKQQFFLASSHLVLITQNAQQRNVDRKQTPRVQNDTLFNCNQLQT